MFYKEYISILYSKAAIWLNALNLLQKGMSMSDFEKQAMIRSFIYCNLYYTYSFDIFPHANQPEKIQNHAIE